MLNLPLLSSAECESLADVLVAPTKDSAAVSLTQRELSMAFDTQAAKAAAAIRDKSPTALTDMALTLKLVFAMRSDLKG